MVVPATAQGPSAALREGETVADRYTVLRELGRGGMAAVYLCFDSASDETVALKVLFFEQPGAAEKYAVWFHQEARALAALEHDSIVRARDFGSLPNGAPYLVMDALEGRSLHAWKHISPPPWDAVWTIGDQVFSGLAHAHARGIVHGDLKPSNIMVDPRGGEDTPRAFILDLGLAWLLSDRLDPRLGSEHEAPAMPLGGGTPGWLAPEQIRNATPHVGPATDLYALGCILYELLTGKEVFTGTPDDVLRQHRDLSPPDPQLKPGVPQGVKEILLTLLAKRPWHRYRFAADARRAWAALAPDRQIRWAPLAMRISGAGLGAPPKPDVSETRPAKRHVAPGIIALRPCPLVGREKERFAIERIVQSVCEGRGPTHEMVLMGGQAGVGKSRLAEWVCEYVHEHALMVPLRARYRATPSPLDGLRGAILTHYNVVGEPRDVVEQALLNEWEVAKNDDDGRTWIAATAAWLRPPAPDEPQAVGPTGKRFVIDKPELARAIVKNALSRIARGSPLAIWLDDVHLAPAATAEGLLALHQDIAELPLLLVATVRSEALDADPIAQARTARLSGVFPTTRIELSPMNPEQTRALLQATLPLDEESENLVIERSRGNPLFALQLVHAWAGGGHFTLRDGVYAVVTDAARGRAATTAELWDQRLAELSREHRAAAYAASALGADIPRDVIEQLFTTMALHPEPVLVTLRRAQLLFPEAGGRFRWAHALLHEHLFGRLREFENTREVFRLAADALLFHPDAGTDRIVRHRAQNLLFADEATAAAEAVFNHVAVLWSRVRDATAVRSLVSILDGRVTGRYEVQYERWRAECERHDGNLAIARGYADSARKKFQELGDTDDEAHTERLLAQIACDEGRPAEGRADVEAAYAKFLASGNDAGRAECELVLGQIESLLGNHEDARVRLEHAARGFRETGESLPLAQCILVMARSEMAAGRLRATRELLERARIEFADLGYLVGLTQVDLALAQAALAEGVAEEALWRALAAKSRFSTLGSARGMTDAARLAGMAALVLGNVDRGREEARLAYRLATEGRSDPWGQVESACLLAQACLLSDDRAGAASYLALAESVPIEDAEPTQHRLLTGAWLSLLLGDQGPARMALTAARRVFSDPRRTGDATPHLLERMLPLAEGTETGVQIEAWSNALANRSSVVPPPPRTDSPR